MKTNTIMDELLLRYGEFDSSEFTLGPRLMALLQNNVDFKDGAYVLASLSSASTANYHLYGDLTGYECSINHIHIDDYLDTDKDDLSEGHLLRTCLVFAERLQKELSAMFPAEIFRIILSYSAEKFPSCVVRFHKVREGENWLMDDLEGYSSEAIMIIDTNNVHN